VRNLGKVVGHIPARGGSKRVAAKNLRYLCGKPLLAYAIECARASGVLDEVYVNTDSEVMGQLAEACGAKFYRRKPELAGDDASGDDFTADFMRTVWPTTLVMVSPVCPLVTADDVRTGIEAYRTSTCDTLITCHETQMQTFCEGRPVNIDLSGPLAPTQRNPVVQILNWAVTIWDVAAFLRSYEERSSGYIGTNRRLLPIDPGRALKISHEEDFRMAELLLHALGVGEPTAGEARYWKPEDGTPWL
jgi:CMP-N-acetylneuraminic acid synthetase